MGIDSACNVREGAMCSCANYFLMLFPTKEKALQAFAEHSLDVFGIKATSYQIADRILTVRSMTSFLADHLNCHVDPYTPNDLFLCVKMNEQYMQILYNEKIYWIINTLNLIERRQL